MTYRAPFHILVLLTPWRNKGQIGQIVSSWVKCSTFVCNTQSEILQCRRGQQLGELLLRVYVSQSCLMTLQSLEKLGNRRLRRRRRRDYNSSWEVSFYTVGPSHLWYFVEHFWRVPPVVGLIVILQLLCSQPSNRNFQKNPTKHLAKEGTPHIVVKMRSSGHQPPTSLESWGYGVLCVTLISLMSVTGVFLLPLMSKSFYRKLLSALIGLAVGSLLGKDVYLNSFKEWQVSQELICHNIRTLYTVVLDQ